MHNYVKYCTVGQSGTRSLEIFPFVFSSKKVWLICEVFFSILSVGQTAHVNTNFSGICFIGPRAPLALKSLRSNVCQLICACLIQALYFEIQHTSALWKVLLWVPWVCRELSTGCCIKFPWNVFLHLSAHCFGGFSPQPQLHQSH